MKNTGSPRVFAESASATEPIASNQRELRKELGTFASLETAAGASTYLLSSEIVYAVERDSARVLVREYKGRGTFIDGIDLGEVQFTSQASWSGSIAEGGAVRLSGGLAWRDRSGQPANVSLVLRATVLANDDLAYITTVISAGAGSGGLCSELHIQMPAGW